MEFQDVVRARRMQRSYTQEPVDPAAVDRILRAARRAPSAGYSQGQAFVVITDDDMRKRVAEALDESAWVAEGRTPWVSKAPVQVVVCVSEALYHERYQQPDKLAVGGGQEITWPVPFWFVDAGASMMLLLLAAVDEGLAAGFAGHPDQEARLRELLGLPDHQVPIGVVTIGHPADDPNAPSSSAMTRRRRAQADVVHHNRW